MHLFYKQQILWWLCVKTNNKHSTGWNTIMYHIHWIEKYTGIYIFNLKKKFTKYFVVKKGECSEIYNPYQNSRTPQVNNKTPYPVLEHYVQKFTRFKIHRTLYSIIFYCLSKVSSIFIIIH